MQMVFGLVGLGRGRLEVRTDLGYDLLAEVEHLCVEHATAVLGGED
jgi:hypothetical protein